MEINPQTVTPEYAQPTNTPCGPWITSYDRLNPWQVVWNQISFAPDPYQQMFNFQDNRYGPGLQRREYILDQDKTYNITIQQTEEYAYFTYGGFYDDATGDYIPIQYVGTTLSSVKGSDIGAAAWFNYYRDYPYGLYNYDSKYTMKIKRDVPAGTEIVMSVFDGQETINYHTRIEVPTFTLASTTNEDTLLHYYDREIEFYLNFQGSGGNCQLDGYGGAYPVGIKFNIEIVQGQQYGNLYYPGTVANPEQSGTSITDLEDEYGIGICNYVIRYTADGVQPDTSTPAIVTIRCTANDADVAPIEVSFPVKYNDDPPDEGGYIIVSLDKESYEPGDTAIVFNRWLTGYGEEINFDNYQLFDAEITAGNEYGVLYNPYSGEISSSLQDAYNGFRVITSSSIAEDSVAIILKVKTRVGGGLPARMITNKTGETERKETDKEEIKQLGNTESLIIGGNDELEGFGKVVVKQDECDEEIYNAEIIEPQKISPDTSEIILMRSDSYWDWVDKNGELHVTMIGDPSNYGCKEAGLTLFLYMIHKRQNVYWKFEDDLRIKILLDKLNKSTDEYRWIFNIENLRIPILSDVSKINNDDAPNLGDGTNETILSQFINNDSIYSIVMRDLYLYWDGVYRHQYEKTTFSFFPGIIAHEYYHFLQKKKYVTKVLNEITYPFIRDSLSILKRFYPCPENARLKQQSKVKNKLLTGVAHGCDLSFWEKGFEKVKMKNEMGVEIIKDVPIKELRADDFAKDTYQKIIDKVKSWAIKQSWYNN